MDLALSNRVALVTGGSKGIGLAISERLLREGATVVVCGRDGEQLEKARARLSGHGSIICIAADVRDPKEVKRLVVATTEEAGQVDVLVNNVGGFANAGSYEDLDESDWVESFELNLMSAVNTSLGVIAGMRERGWGRIVNIASESGVQPDAFFLTTLHRRPHSCR